MLIFTTLIQRHQVSSSLTWHITLYVKCVYCMVQGRNAGRALYCSDRRLACRGSPGCWVFLPIASRAFFPSIHLSASLHAVSLLSIPSRFTLHPSLLYSHLPSLCVLPLSLPAQPRGIQLLITLHQSLPRDLRLHRVTEQSPTATKERENRAPETISSAWKITSYSSPQSVCVWVPAEWLKLALIRVLYSKHLNIEAPEEFNDTESA